MSLIPIVIDSMSEWITYMKRHVLYKVSRGRGTSKKETPISQTPSAVRLAAPASVSNKHTVQLQEKDFQTYLAENQRPQQKAPWRPPGKHPF